MFVVLYVSPMFQFLFSDNEFSLTWHIPTFEHPLLKRLDSVSESRRIIARP